jgi:Ca2+-binding RTX toxin-like protein
MALPVSGSPTQFFNAQVIGEILTGTSGNDQLKTIETKPGSSESYMYGGLGDDTYITLASKDRIFENAGEGIDTVKTNWFYSLPANVENITLTGTFAVAAQGNELDNILIGNSGKNFLDGGLGADEMTGGAGNDTFVLKGNDIIMDFSAGDHFDIREFTQFSSLSQVQSVMQQLGNNVVLNLTQTDVVTILNANISQFDADDFLLASDLSRYTLAFEDNFDSLSLNYGTNSEGTWYPLFPRTGLAGHTTPDKGSVQYFTYIGDDGSTGEQVGINPFSIDNGILTIEMMPVPQNQQYKMYGYDYSSGMINTAASFSQTYGYFEIRAKLAAGFGLHDAFWMLPIDGNWPPEFDIVEGIGRDPGNIINVAHAIDSGLHLRHSKQFSVPTATTEFHTYGVDWQPDYITWYIDGVAVRSQPTPPGLDVPVYMLASLGGGSPYAGIPNSTTPWPAHMEIDYIRAYASPNTVEKGVPFDTMGTDGNDILYGTSLGDTLNGGAGDDTLYGGAGHDVLIGGEGVNLLDGGFGNDHYIVTNTTTAVSEGGIKGIDTVETTLAKYTLVQNFEDLLFIGTGNFQGIGNTEANYIQGGAGADTLSGGIGDDRLSGGDGNDSLIGGDGHDTVFGGADADSIRGNNGNDVLHGEDGNDLIRSDDGDDQLFGGSGDDNLQGGAGDDLLDGGAGKDRMSGGLGDDTYVVDLASDAVIELADEGFDTVQTTLASYTLSANVENLLYAGTGNFAGTGNALANILSGGAGIDTLTGAAGDDVFSFTAANANNDTVTDFTGAGVAGGDKLSFIGFGIDGTISRIGVSDSFLVQGGVGYEGAIATIRLAGVTALASDDYVFIPENRAPTELSLAAGTIAENMAVGSTVGTLTSVDPDLADVNSFTLLDDAGGRFSIAGNHIILEKVLNYETAKSHDVTVRVTDLAGLTLDRTFTIAVDDVNDTAPIITSLAAATSAENQIAVASLTATDPDTSDEPTVFTIAGGADAELFQINGNALEFKTAPDFESASHGPIYNVIVRASDGVNTSSQAMTVTVTDVKTNDTLAGSAGDDAFVYSDSVGFDGVDGLGGFDTLGATAGASGAWVLADGNKVLLDLDRNGQTDVSATNVERLSLAGGLVTVQGSLAGTGLLDVFVTGTDLADNLNGSLGAVSLSLMGGAGDDVLVGGSAADTLDGGIGRDMMTGGMGDDVYVVDQTTDVISELANAGSDSVRTALGKYTLGANLENLTYTGVAAFTGTGNALANSISGGKGADRLDGLAGADLLQGGLGNDTYVVDNAGDVVVELFGEGNDRVLSKVSHTLGDNIETLQLSTSTSINGTGNAIANTIVGNAGANILDGRGGADKLTGGSGVDTFVFQRGEANGDLVTDFAGAGVAGGDILHLSGFGTGAFIAQVGQSDSYVIYAGVEYAFAAETIRLAGVTALDAGDFIFV